MTPDELPTIDDFHVGQRAEFRKTFTDEDIEHFIAITSDENPLHVDDEFAARTFFGKRIAHGMLTASILSTNDCMPVSIARDEPDPSRPMPSR